MKITEIIRHQPLGLKILNKYGLNDAACRHLPFEEACESCSVNPILIKQELLEQKKSFQKNLYPINQIIHTALLQHEVVKQQMGVVYSVLETALEMEFSFRQKLLLIHKRLIALSESLEMHLYKEKEILFPRFIKQSGNQPALDFNILYPIERLEHEHESTVVLLEEIRKLRTSSGLASKNNPHLTDVCYAIACLENELVALIYFENTQMFPVLVSMEIKDSDSS